MDKLWRLRAEVFKANLGIYQAGLVTMHGGKASGIDRAGGRIVIKPRGVDYEKLSPPQLVVTDLDGNKLRTGEASDSLNPSVALPHHSYLYRHCPELGGVVHTHSSYATSFALLGRGLPAYQTAIADEFKDDVPCAHYADNASDPTGEAILSHRTQASVILLAHHGVFTFSSTPKRRQRRQGCWRTSLSVALRSCWALQVLRPEAKGRSGVSTLSHNTRTIGGVRKRVDCCPQVRDGND